MDFLRRALAPISQEAWDEIDDQAKKVFKTLLTVRKIADVKGPYGFEYAAVPKGRLHVPDKQNEDELTYGINEVLPLIEVRVPFKLNKWELDNAVRGAVDIDLDPLQEAAYRIAKFEEDSIFKGLKHIDFPGLSASTGQESISMGDQYVDMVTSVSKGMYTLINGMVEGPYAFLVTSDAWQYISSKVDGIPLKQHIEGIIGGPVIMSPFADKCILTSLRGGDLELILGQDLSIGYKTDDTKSVYLYFTESFTFRVVDPDAFIVLE
jgi:uncharacterized linocin/CFP29 family protein